jgi:acyl carrier protein
MTEVAQPTPQPNDVIAQIAEIMGVSADHVQMTSRVLEDLDMDSLELIELLVWADVRFPSDLSVLMAKTEWMGVRVGDLVELFHRPSA